MRETRRSNARKHSSGRLTPIAAARSCAWCSSGRPCPRSLASSLCAWFMPAETPSPRYSNSRWRRPCHACARSKRSRVRFWRVSSRRARALAMRSLRIALSAATGSWMICSSRPSACKAWVSSVSRWISAASTLGWALSLGQKPSLCISPSTTSSLELLRMRSYSCARVSSAEAAGEGLGGFIAWYRLLESRESGRTTSANYTSTAGISS
jgi:hypothetical protein